MTAPGETRRGLGGALFPVPTSPGLARTLRWQYAFLFVVGVVFWGGYLLHEGDALRVGYKMDFLGIYVGPRILASGQGARLYDLQTQAAVGAAVVVPLKRSIMPFVYPAYVAVILRPLGMLDFRSALKIWFLVNITAVVWSAFRLGKVFGCSSWERLIVLIIFLAWPPLELTLIQGQMGLMPTVAFTEALIALRVRREWQAGFWLSLGLIKPQMILFPLLWFVLRKSRRVLTAFSAITIAVLTISIVNVGFWIPNYLHFLEEYNRRGAELALWPIAMQNWRGLASWLMQADYGPAVAAVIVGFTAVSVVGVCIVAKDRSAGHEFTLRDESTFAFAIVLGLLSSPHLYMHDWVAALPAGFVLWAFAREGYERNPGNHGAAMLLWLIGLSPLVFFTKHFIRTLPTVPVFGIVFASVAIWVLSSSKLSTPATEPGAEVASA